MEEKGKYLFKNMTFLVADRGDKDSFEKAEYLKIKYNADIRFMTCEFLNISSTNIRNLFYEDKKENQDNIDNKLLEFNMFIIRIFSFISAPKFNKFPRDFGISC